MSPSRRRQCIEHVMKKHGVKERLACRVLGQHRSTQRKVPLGRADDARRTQIVLTPEGVQMKAHIETLMRILEEELIAGLGTQANEIVEALSQIDTALSKRLRRLR